MVDDFMVSFTFSVGETCREGSVGPQIGWEQSNFFDPEHLDRLAFLGPW